MECGDGQGNERVGGIAVAKPGCGDTACAEDDREDETELVGLDAGELERQPALSGTVSPCGAAMRAFDGGFPFFDSLFIRLAVGDGLRAGAGGVRWNHAGGTELRGFGGVLRSRCRW